LGPFFTIAVTVYDRKEFLYECLTSILQQTFKNFEIIVGNDYTGEKFSSEMFGINDSRIRFINHTQNIGEISNMNKLLEMSRGRYFTWLADDDMYTPTFLEMIRSALDKYDFPPCVFTSYMQGSTLPLQTDISNRKIQVLPGRDFLRRYLSRELKISGTLGVFDRQYIRQLGGIEQLGDGFSPYSDNLLAIKAAVHEKVIYINAPLVFFRLHDNSISLTSPDVDAYSSAQRDLLPRCISVFKSEGLSDDFHSNLFLLLKWCLSNYCAVMCRSGSLQFGKLIKYILFLTSYLKKLKTHRCEMMVIILRSTHKLVMQMVKESFKNKISLNFRKV